MMNKNMNSPTKLTEFAPLSPEESQPAVASLFSKFFGFGKSASSNYSTATATSPNNDEQQSSSGDSDSWKQLDGAEKEKYPKEDDSASSINFPLDASEGRSLPNVLKRISNIVALKSNNLKSYKDSQLRTFWVSDSVAKQCYECGERFTAFRRKHHCRVCGQIFCSKCCSDEIPGKIMGCTGDLRVCTYCCKVVLSYLESSDMRSVLSADLKALQEDLQVKYGNDSRSRPKKHHASNDSLNDEARVYRKPSCGYMEEKYALGRSSSCYLATTQEPSVVLQNSAPLRMIYEELFRSSSAIPLQTHRIRLKSFYNCFMGNELVNWMLLQKKAATRVQAAAIGQALLEAGFIESAQSENLHFVDSVTLFRPRKLSLMRSIDLSDENQTICDSQEPAWVKNIPQHDSTTDSESDTKVSSPQGSSAQALGRLPSSSSSFYLDLNVEASTVTLKRPTFEDCTSSPVESKSLSAGDGSSGCYNSSRNISGKSSTDGTTTSIEQKEINLESHRCDSGVSDELLNDTLQVHEFKERNSWHKVNNLRSTFGEMSAYNALTSAYKQHQDSLIGQLLNKEGLSESWREPILSLGHNIVDHVRPDLYHDADDMDIGQYVQIKKLPGGRRSDCDIVSGVVCSKNVAHRGMNAVIAHPKILLLECGLMYQRVEGKLLSLEPVMLQEKEYLGHTVARITALGANVVLVHRSVSRLAQDRFRQCGITLVLNVKLSVLERVARCTGGTIVSTIDAHLTTRYNLGTCSKFYLRSFSNESANGGKTLMYFEGCENAHLGATILLRGGSLPELKKVKNVMSTMIFALYSWRLEKSFLMDEFAKPPCSHSDNTFLDEDSYEETILQGELPEVRHSRSLACHESRGLISCQSDGLVVYSSEDHCDETRNGFGSTPPSNFQVEASSVIGLPEPACSTPVKDSTVVEHHGDEDDDERHTETTPDAESFMSVETFKRVSTMLEEHSDPYDTLKLFKTKATSSKTDDDGRIDRSEDDPTVAPVDKSSKAATTVDETRSKSKLKEKIPSEEKRVYGESVRDQSDPLHQYLKEGRDEDELDRRARVADNEKTDSRLEDSDAFGKPPLATSPEGQSLSVADLPLLNKFKKALDDTILSFSPYLKFSVPYLETEAGRNCALRRFFPKEIFYSAQLSDQFEGVRASATTLPTVTAATSALTSNTFAKPSRAIADLTNLRMKPKHPFVDAKFTSSVESRQIQALVANFRACGSRLYPTQSVVSEKPNLPTKTEVVHNNGLPEQQRPIWLDCLEPDNHQRLSVLFCSFSHSRNNAPAFCVNPSVVNMDLYGRNDIALGRFLERYCLTTEYKCPAQPCRAKIAQHARRFAHDGGCVHVSLTELSTDPFGQADSDQILMWTKCTECKTVSAVVPMSLDTWSLSFAKYLELRFHGGVYTRRGPESDSNLNSVCRHSLHHEHSQYFTKKNMLAVFMYSKISQWEISLPPPLVHINYDTKQHANVIEEIKILALKGDEVFTNIRDKLSNLQLELEGSLNGGTSGGTGSGNGISGLVTAKQQLAKEQQYFKNKIEEIQLKLTSPTLENKKLEGTRSSEKQVQNLMFRIEDGIVISKRLISEAVSNWNTRIQEMAAKRKDDRPRRFTERSLTSGGPGSGGTGGTGSFSGAATGATGSETDGYVTEDTASESQIEDLSPMSADYSAVDAISAVHKADFQAPETIESSDNEIRPGNNTIATNLEEIVVIQESPKYHQRSHSDVLPISSDDMPDRKKKKKTILSQLLPSTTIINPISNPLGSFEHHLLPLGSVVPMVVYESEPSSIIAYALDSHDYKHALAEILRTYKGPELNPSPLYRRKFPDNKENPAGGADSTQSGESKRPSVLSFLRGNSPSPASPMETADCKTVSPAEPSSVINSATSAAPESEEDKKSSVKQQTYIEVQFNDATTNFYCRIYFAAQFAALRENVLPSGEDGFTRSLCRSIQWAARGGKSGSAFCKSRDDRFILKELSRIELQIFLEFAPNYFAYMEKCQQTKQPTLLGKIVGVYRVSFKNNTTNAALRTSVLVMENLFYGRAITDKFDLKGSVRNRLVNPEEADSEGELVLLDENLLNMSCDSPLYIRSHSKAVLNKAIEQDTKFLADNSVMDYSLLVGLEPNSDELVLGIIDYIRTFTWDKKLETMVKKSGILGGQGKLPTIVSPEEYRARFIAAMNRYFLPVPDRWTGLARGVESAP